jgi:hypothetical protein
MDVEEKFKNNWILLGVIFVWSYFSFKMLANLE